MKKQFSDEQIRLLGEVFMHQAPSSIEVMERLINGFANSEDRTYTCELIGNEFCATGLDDDGEPTSRGMVLEALLDVVNHPNIS